MAPDRALPQNPSARCRCAGGTSYPRSNSVSRGKDIVTYDIGDDTVGCSICYDIRFP
jgi:predicted amidohydrolase